MFSRRFLGPSVECYRLSLEFETPPQEIIDVAANGGSSGVGGSAVASLLAPSSSDSKPIAAAAAKPSSSSTSTAAPSASASASSPPRQGPQTLQSIEDQWRKRASADHRSYTSVVVEWSSNESAAVVGARAAAAVAVRQGDESGGGGTGVGGGAPTVERVSLSFLPASDGGDGVSAKLSVSRVRARLARLEFSRGGSGGASAAATAAAPATNGAAAAAAATAAAAAAAPEHSHPVAAILAALPLEGLRRVRCCEGTVLEALEALLPAEIEVEAVAEEKKEEEGAEGGGGGGEVPATTTEEAPSLPPSLPASLNRSPRHSFLRIRSLCLTRCGKGFFFREKESARERSLLYKNNTKKLTFFPPISSKNCRHSKKTKKNSFQASPSSPRASAA